MLDGLTPRQREIVAFIEQGRSNKEIASLLDIGVGTVKQHVAALFRRLNVTSRAQAVAVLRGLSNGDMRRRAEGLGQERPQQASQESAALGAECRVLSVAALVLDGAEGMAQAMGTRRLLETLENLTQTGREAAELFGGQCFERTGLGIELRFGFIRADKDDAGNAIRAARFVMERVTGDGGEALIRCGVATGVGVIVAQVGFPARPLACAELAYAWRLAHNAQSGHILACEATQRLTGHALSFESPVSGSGLGRAAQVRGEALPAAPGLLSAPRRTLLERIENLLLHTASVTLEGGQGLGRSTLAAALGERQRSAGAFVFYIPAGKIGPAGDSSGLSAGLEIALGLGYADGAAERQARLQSFLKDFGLDNSETEAVLRSLLTAGDEPPDILQCMGAIKALAQKRRMLILVDDAEDAPQPLAQLLADLLAECPNIRLLLLCTALPPALSERISSQPRLALPPLADEEMAALVGACDPERQLDESLLRAVIRQAQGRPGDAAELVQALLARIKTKGDGQAPQGLPMPLKLYAGLIALMDRSSDLRDALRLAALLGRFFTPQLLARFWPKGQKSLDEALGQAVDAGLLIQEGAGQNLRLSFARPLVKEAAALSWLAADRSRMRARIERTRVRVGVVPLSPAQGGKTQDGGRET